MILRKIILALLMIPICGFSQENEESKEITKHRNFIFNTSIPIELASFNGEKFVLSENDNNDESESGQRFKVLYEDKEHVYLRFFNYRNEESEKQKKYVYDNGNKYFRISKKIFDEVVSKIYPIYAGEKFGLVSIPFKVRLGDNDFETNANIGLNLAFMYRLNRKVKDRWILQPNIGIGLADIPLNESNSDIEKAENRTALSFSFGLMLNISKNINLGAFLGWDKLNKANQSVNWKYQNKGWLGIGINIGFAENSSEKGDPINKNN